MRFLSIGVTLLATGLQASAANAAVRGFQPWFQKAAPLTALRWRTPPALSPAAVRALRDENRRLPRPGPATREGPLFVSLSPEAQAAVREGVLQTVRDAAKDGGRPVVVFDIDGTILAEGTRDSFLRNQRPLSGAVEYVRALVNAGARVVYLTARSEWFGDATTAQLHKAGFPVQRKHAFVLSSPTSRRQRTLNAELWKIRGGLTLLARVGKVVAVFENEIAVAQGFRAALPDPVVVARLNTNNTTVDRTGPAGIQVLDHFGP